MHSRQALIAGRVRVLRILFSIPLLLLAGSLSAQPVTSPSTNLASFDALLADCVSEVLPAGLIESNLPVDGLSIDLDRSADFLRSGLVRTLLDRGIAVYDPDSTAARYRLRIELDQAAVSYRRKGRGTVYRHISVAARPTLLDADARILDERVCRREESDLVPRDALDAIEHPAFPPTQGERPGPGGWRRIAEPVALATALGTIVYLFFTIRSAPEE